MFERSSYLNQQDDRVIRTLRFRLRDVLKLQAWFRGQSIRRALETCHQAAIAIQTHVRRVQHRTRALKMRSVAILTYESNNNRMHQFRESLQLKRHFIEGGRSQGPIDLDVIIPVSECYPTGWVATLHALWSTLEKYDATIEHIAVGECHSVALTSNGELYSWGWNDLGQLGHGTTKSHYKVPRRVVYQDCFARVRIKQIAAGFDFTAFLDANGRVLTFGCNKRGQLGLSSQKASIATPRMVSLEKHFVQKIAAGANHVVSLTARGELFAWGAGACLGLGLDGSEDQNSPGRVALRRTGLFVVDVACGFGHTLVLVRDSRGSFQGNIVYSFGCNNAGQLGVSDQVHRHAPTRVPILGFVDAIACGGFHSLVLGRQFLTQHGMRQIVDTVDGLKPQFMLAFGKNSNGELGTGDTVSRSKPSLVHGLPLDVTKTTLVLQIACGTRSSSALLSSGDGWNERWMLFWGVRGGKRFCNPTTAELPPSIADFDSELNISTSWSQTYSVTFLKPLTKNAPPIHRGAHFHGYAGPE